MEAAGKPTQGCIGGDDPMAGNDQGNRVGAERMADGARRLRLAEAGGDPLIGSHAAVGNVGGGATLAEPGTASIGPTVAGANGAVWAGTTHDLAALGGYAAIQPATAVFWWDNAGQQFRFWFRGFPDAFQTLAGGLERGKFYFFQTPANANIPMN